MTPMIETLSLFEDTKKLFLRMSFDNWTTGWFSGLITLIVSSYFTNNPNLANNNTMCVSDVDKYK